MGASQAIQLNSRDLEDGNAGKGLPEGIGSGQGDWRLELASDLDIQVLAYVRLGTSKGHQKSAGEDARNSTGTKSGPLMTRSSTRRQNSLQPSASPCCSLFTVGPSLTDSGMGHLAQSRLESWTIRPTHRPL